jgi:hypothetical protein
VVPPCSLDEDVVGGALAGPVIPAGEQVAVGKLNDRGGMVVPLFGREDQLAGKLRGGAGGERQE